MFCGIEIIVYIILLSKTNLAKPLHTPRNGYRGCKSTLR